MPLSTFSSETAGRIALATAAAFLLIGEIGVRVAFTRISAIESRTAADYAAANAIGSRPGDKPSILLTGNSLLLEALDYPRVRADLADRARVVRFVIEQTLFWDWYYGIRRLLAAGARPGVIVLCMNPTHLISPAIRGEYSSYYLFQLTDIPGVAKAAHYDLTQASGLVFGRFSLLYAGRNNLRNFVLNRTDPSYGAWLHAIKGGPPAQVSPEALERAAESRLRLFQEEVSRYGVRGVFMLPPEGVSGEREIITAAHNNGLELMAPIAGAFCPTGFTWTTGSMQIARARRSSARLSKTTCERAWTFGFRILLSGAKCSKVHSGGRNA
jgi:hypothetical protein